MILAALALAVLILAGCQQAQSNFYDTVIEDSKNHEIVDEEIDETQGDKPTYGMEQLAMHNTDDDCWMAINGKVYDVTDYVDKHPGSDSILEGCGREATELFETRPMGSGTPHSDNARQKLDDYEIGDYVPEFG